MHVACPLRWRRRSPADTNCFICMERLSQSLSLSLYPTLSCFCSLFSQNSALHTHTHIFTLPLHPAPPSAVLTRTHRRSTSSIWLFLYSLKGRFEAMAPSIDWRSDELRFARALRLSVALFQTERQRRGAYTPITHSQSHRRVYTLMRGARTHARRLTRAHQ